jgi:hypothetical protein
MSRTSSSNSGFTASTVVTRNDSPEAKYAVTSAFSFASARSSARISIRLWMR